MSLRKRYDSLKETVNNNICGDGYNAEGRTEKIVNKCNAIIDEAYELGYKKAIEDVLKLERHWYKTYRKGFIEEEAVFIGDIKQLEQKGE